MQDTLAATRLRRICKDITATRVPRVGATGYIDDQVKPLASLTKGEDENGRAFLTICLRSEGYDTIRKYKSCGVVTIFQRYRDDELVTQANNSAGPGRVPVWLIRSAATAEEMAFITRLVEDGEAERTTEGTVGDTLHERIWIVPPDEACS
jgi:hypothetical protein